MNKQQYKYLGVIAVVLAVVGFLLTLASMSTVNEALSKGMSIISSVSFVLMVLVMIFRWVLISKDKKKG